MDLVEGCLQLLIVYVVLKQALKLILKRNVSCCSAIDTLLKQERLSEGQKRRASRKFTSRVHVEDICQVLKAATEKPASGFVYPSSSMIILLRWMIEPLRRMNQPFWQGDLQYC